LVQYKIRAVAPAPSNVIYDQRLQPRGLQHALICDIKLIAINHDPGGTMFSREFHYLGSVLLAGRSRHDSGDLTFLCAEPLFYRGSGFRHGKNAAPAFVLPGLGERQAAHDVACAHGDAGVGAKDESTGRHQSSRSDF
jgi:hypothetical protein